jgi:hypothetical protein
MKDSEHDKKCAHPGCNCAATMGDYCSEQCRNAPAGQTECTCGHRDCQ